MTLDFATFDLLRDWNNDLTTNERSQLKSRTATYSATLKDTFLSHSSKDADLLPAVIKLLENHGAHVYCDMGDARLPENPTPETAAILKHQISRSDRLVVFVTTNTKDSRWVPWELGVGDVELLPDNVALLPVAQNTWEKSWAQQEYLGLYRHIVWGNITGEPNPLWMVFDFRTNTATPLHHWCRPRKFR